jgi:hypothetical protein
VAQVNLLKASEDLPEAALDVFIDNTPIRTGNARRNTSLSNTTITAAYPYASRLDEGYSRQSPRGMVEPTEKWIQQEMDRRLKGL